MGALPNARNANRSHPDRVYAPDFAAAELALVALPSLRAGARAVRTDAVVLAAEVAAAVRRQCRIHGHALAPQVADREAKHQQENGHSGQPEARERCSASSRCSGASVPSVQLLAVRCGRRWAP